MAEPNTYATLPVDTVLRCPKGRDVYVRLTDGEPYDWAALHVETAALIDLNPAERPRAVALLAVDQLPAGLVVLAPVAETAPAPVVEIDLGDEMDALVTAVFAPVAGVS